MTRLGGVARVIHEARIMLRVHDRGHGASAASSRAFYRRNILGYPGIGESGAENGLEGERGF